MAAVTSCENNLLVLIGLFHFLLILLMMTFLEISFVFLTEEEGTVIHEHLGKEQSRLALYVVNQLNLVPEHVETRSLYSKTQQPNMEQVSL